VATTLARQSTTEIALVLLRNLSANPPMNRADLAKIEGRLRRCMLKELLLARPPDVLVADLVGEGPAPRSVALLSACLVPFLREAKSTESVHEIILSAYERWLHPGRVDWSCPLADDELEMAWLLAGILCEEQSPSTRWRLLEQHAVTRTEGWGVVQDNVNEAIRARAHVYVVGAMATEWLVRRERQTNAVELLKMVLGGLHQWVRTLTDMVWEEHISAAMMQSWARAHLVFGERSAEELVQLVPLVDRLEWLVNSAAAYRANRGDRSAEPLPENLRIALRERIVPMLRVWELRHTTDVETRKSLLDTVEGLAS
jgi:hypothetical protein